MDAGGGEIGRMDREIACRQDVIHEGDDRGRSHQVGDHALRGGLGRFCAGQLGRETVGRLQNLRIEGSDRGKEGFTAPAYAADHLPAVLAVAGIDIDEVAKPGENPVAERAAFVVIDCADKDYQLRTVQLALEQAIQPVLIFDIFGDVLGRKPEGIRISFGQHLGLVPPDVRLDKILPDKVFLFHQIAVRDDEARFP